MAEPFFRIMIVAVLALGFQLPLTRADDQPPPAVTAAEALTRLKDGNARFVANKPLARDLAKRRDETAKGQKPFAIVLACADSRVSPELLFDQGIGDVFVVRVAGNVTDPVVLGSIEFSVQQMSVPLIVVLGHEDCGAVAAAITGKPAEGNLGELVKRIHIGNDKPDGKEAALAYGIRTNASHQAAEMTKRSTILKDFAEAGRIKIVTGVYALDSGKVEWLK